LANLREFGLRNYLRKWLEQYLNREVGEYTEDETGLKKSFVTFWRAAQPDPPILFIRSLRGSSENASSRRFGE
jgi:hypothetical protein